MGHRKGKRGCDSRVDRGAALTQGRGANLGRAGMLRKHHAVSRAHGGRTALDDDEVEQQRQGECNPQHQVVSIAGVRDQGSGIRDQGSGIRDWAG